MTGWYPDRKVRLYHRAKAQWVGDFVHESVKVSGRVGHLGLDPQHLKQIVGAHRSQHERRLAEYRRILSAIQDSEPLPIASLACKDEIPF